MKKTVSVGSLRLLVVVSAVFAGLLAIAALAFALAARQQSGGVPLGTWSLAGIAAILGLAALFAVLLAHRLKWVVRAGAVAGQGESVSHLKALHDSEVISTSVLSCVPQAIVATDVGGLIRLFSPGAENMLGYAAGEVVGKHTPMLFHDPEELRNRTKALSEELGVEIAPDFNAFVARALGSGRHDDQEWTYVRQDGSRLTVLLTINPLRDAQGEIEGFLGVATDVTERTLAAAKFTRMAHYDHLTRLPNRRLLHDRMQVAIKQARRDQARLAFMLIDLDKFKPVNDEHGHSVGDLLLKIVARRMQACLRESDTLARVGGDEFVVVLPGIAAPQDALKVAEMIRLELNRPFDLDGGYSVQIACSIGVAIYPEHGLDEKTLSKNADDAMYIAKEYGRNRVHMPHSGGEGEGGVEHAGGRDLSFIRLVWQRSYRCGEETIDREHHELFDRANTLIHASIAGDDGAAKLQLALDELIDSVVRHFASEESILARYRYTGLDDHAGKHRALVEHAGHLRRRAEKGELSLGELVTYLSQELVVKHMLKEDRKFYPLFQKPSERRSEEARDDWSGDSSGDDLQLLANDR